jgi:hypothetical protein
MYSSILKMEVDRVFETSVNFTKLHAFIPQKIFDFTDTGRA